MGLETVKEEIISNAKARAASIVQEVRKEAHRITKETESRIEKMKQDKEAETKKLFDAIKSQELASGELESKKMLLEAKKEMIEKVFAQANKRLVNLEDKKMEAYIRKLVDRARNEIGIGYIFCSKKDAKFIKDFTVEPVNIIGGIVVENKEKTVRIDYSFETMLQSIKENELQSISKLLFG